ncbi:hypothetical protein [Nocardia sp. CNY236]|uniref:hypothetical protein n=1 Tax=Nocardia sp. CNY236 TaxID=1169152 RepID=UPI00041B3D45|nr:hypothetical protein [Nocardia sp. CNY236]
MHIPSEVPRAAAQRARDLARLAEVFGDALPEVTSDERDEDGDSSTDEWLHAQVPPHHV